MDGHVEHRFTRRATIMGGLAAFGTAAWRPQMVSAADEIDTYVLDPVGSGSQKCRVNCAACGTCRTHAANKLFSTEKAADAGRAHPFCRCAVILGQPLSSAIHHSLFATTDSVDRRWASTASVLSAEVEQHSVPMVSGFAPVAALVGGAAGVVWLAARRRELLG